MGYLDELMMLGTGSNPKDSEEPYTPPLSSTTSQGSGITFDMLDAANTYGLANPYTSPASATMTKAVTTPSSNSSPSSMDPLTGKWTTVPSSLNTSITAPVAPMSVAAPTMAHGFAQDYLKTFQDPNSYWDEYSQGRGAQFTEGAARAMAKAGRTGMLPTLNTLAHQDYMTNYLPQVRKDLQPTLTYENQWNQTAVDQYGKELGFSSDRYKTDTTRYGAELDSWIKTLDINTQRDLDVLKMAVDRYNIDTTSKSNLFSSVAQMWPEMSAEDRAYVMAILQGAEGIGAYGASTLAEVTAPSAPTTTLPGNIPPGSMYPENYTG